MLLVKKEDSDLASHFKIFNIKWYVQILDCVGELVSPNPLLFRVNYSEILILLLIFLDSLLELIVYVSLDTITQIESVLVLLFCIP